MHLDAPRLPYLHTPRWPYFGSHSPILSFRGFVRLPAQTIFSFNFLFLALCRSARRSSLDNCGAFLLYSPDLGLEPFATYLAASRSLYHTPLHHNLPPFRSMLFFFFHSYSFLCGIMCYLRLSDVPHTHLVLILSNFFCISIFIFPFHLICAIGHVVSRCALLLAPSPWF
jgi:hypothetical protein